MKIAIGSDHRGGKVAYRLVKDVFLPSHYTHESFDRYFPRESLVGSFIIEGTNVGSVASDVALNEPPRIRSLAYEQDAKDLEQTLVADNLSIDETDPNAFHCVDYPDVAAAVAEAVSDGRADYGVLICGTGIGMCVVANKFKGVRAAVCFNEVAAELSRRHNDANVLCISGEFLSAPAVESLARLWLTTPYDGGRHEPRVAKISKLEEQTGL